jgi:serine protease Do
MNRGNASKALGARFAAAALLPSLLLAAPAAPTEPPHSPLELARLLNQAFIEVADKVSPAVVVIRVAQRPTLEDFGEQNPLWRWLPPQFRRQLEEQWERRAPTEEDEPFYNGQGSGVVIREDGYLLTNRHVVDGADRIQVRFKDGREYEAEIRGVDAQSDIAVLKIDARGLAVAKLGDSDTVRVGEFAIAIGAPFELDYSVTFGHISAKGRSRLILGEEGAKMDQDFLQTDANINPGNSGGPLVNIEGEVIGINTLIRGLRTGIGFAIPSNLAREVADQLIAKGRFIRPWLGISIQPLTESPERRRLTDKVQEGLVVKEILADGPAAKSDLKPFDIITAVDGQKVATAQQLRNAVRARGVGEDLTLDVFRGDEPLQIRVRAEEWPEDRAVQVAHRSVPETERSTSSLGLTVQTLTQELAQELGVRTTTGVVVTEVKPDSAAERQGIRRGDVITEVDRRAVRTADEFQQALRNADLKKGVLLFVASEAGARFEILKGPGE